MLRPQKYNGQQCVANHLHRISFHHSSLIRTRTQTHLHRYRPRREWSISISTGTPTFAPTPTPPATIFNVASMVPREYDAQSLHSESTLVNGNSPALPTGTSVEYLRDLVQKRIITLTYMRNVHEGWVVYMLIILTRDPTLCRRSHWFHTIMMSRSELDRVFNNTAMKKRTKRFAILGMSLSNLLDIHQPQDLLRGLLNTLTEYDQSKEESDKPKMVGGLLVESW